MVKFFNKKAISIGILVGSVLISSCFKENQNVKSAICAEPELTMYEKVLSFDGVVEANNSTIVTIDETNVVKEFYVKEGDIINKGDELFCIDVSDLEDELTRDKNLMEEEKAKYDKQVSNYEEKIEKAKNNSNVTDLTKAVKDAKEEYEKLKKQYEKVKNNKDIEMYEIIYYQSYSNMLAAKAEYSSLQQALEELELENEYKIEQLNSELNDYKENSKYVSIKNSVKELKQKIKNAIVKAQISGVVTEIFTVEYDTVLNGRVMQISDLESKRVTFDVQEENASIIENGMSVKVFTKYDEDNSYSGEITNKSAIIEEGNINVLAEIEDNLSLLIGETVEVNVIIEQVKDVFSIEMDYCCFDKDGDIYILVAKKDNTQMCILEKRYIEPIYELDNNYYVSGDFFKDDEVVVVAPENYKDGQKIKIEC